MWIMKKYWNKETNWTSQNNQFFTTKHTEIHTEMLVHLFTNNNLVVLNQIPDILGDFSFILKNYMKLEMLLLAWLFQSWALNWPMDHVIIKDWESEGVTRSFWPVEWCALPSSRHFWATWEKSKVKWRHIPTYSVLCSAAPIPNAWELDCRLAIPCGYCHPFTWLFLYKAQNATGWQIRPFSWVTKTNIKRYFLPLINQPTAEIYQKCVFSIKYVKYCF